MNNGWIKLHRQFLEWEWYSDGNTMRLFIHLMLNANHETQRWMGTVINRGQIVTGRQSLARELEISVQSVRSALTRLKSTNEITIKVTNRFSIITLNNYEKYQSYENSNQQNNQQTNQQSTSNQPAINHKQEGKEYKKERNVSVYGSLREPTPAQEARLFFTDDQYRQKAVDHLLKQGLAEQEVRAELRKFVGYWTERTKSGIKQRWETERTFEVRRRLATWFNNYQKFSHARTS